MAYELKMMTSYFSQVWYALLANKANTASRTKGGKIVGWISYKGQMHLPPFQIT